MGRIGSGCGKCECGGGGFPQLIGHHLRSCSQLSATVYFLLAASLGVLHVKAACKLAGHAFQGWLIAWGTCRSCLLQASRTMLLPLAASLACPLCLRVQGRCAFTLGQQQVNSHNVLGRGVAPGTGRRYAYGRTGLAPTPGSTTVYDRASQTLVECTPVVCPYATPATLSGVASGGASGTGGGGQATQQAYVNRAPLVNRHDNTNVNVRSSKPQAILLRVRMGAHGCNVRLKRGQAVDHCNGSAV